MSDAAQPTSADPAPRCAWHPDRETYISCSRCGRPICPDCMTTAPVGYQCPACVELGQQRVSATRRAAPGLGLPATAKPYVTYTLIGIAVAVFGIQFLLGVNQVAAQWGMQPLAIAWEGQWYRLITPVFLHASPLHLAFNMYILFVVGQPLERLFGHVRYLVLFLLAGLGGAVASYAFSDPQTLSVGASGAIFGLMGALVVAGRYLQFDVRQVAVLIVVNVVIGFIPGWNIDWRAHLGGLVVGAASAFAMLAPMRKARTSPGASGDRSAALLSLAGLGAVLLAVIALAAWRTAQLQAVLEQAPASTGSSAAAAAATPEIPAVAHRLSTVGDETTPV